jgi:hypothetical protein
VECDQKVVGAIRKAIEVRSYLGDDGNLSSDATEAAMGIASVLKDDATRREFAGASWRDDDGRSNSLFVTEGLRVHAIVAGDTVEVTNYSAGIDTLRAEDFDKFGQFVDDGWRVMKWHVTLRDGSVITPRAENGQHSDELTRFVRTHLVPSRSV